MKYIIIFSALLIGCATSHIVNSKIESAIITCDGSTNKACIDQANIVCVDPMIGAQSQAPNGKFIITVICK